VIDQVERTSRNPSCKDDDSVRQSKTSCSANNKDFTHDKCCSASSTQNSTSRGPSPPTKNKCTASSTRNSSKNFRLSTTRSITTRTTAIFRESRNPTPKSTSTTTRRTGTSTNSSASTTIRSSSNNRTTVSPTSSTSTKDPAPLPPTIHQEVSTST
ncbi:unnamed protein product, partial [Amoebophrya sp. A25]